MRYTQAEKLEIIHLVETSDLPAKQTLGELGIPRSSFYRWYERYRVAGAAGLARQQPGPRRFWNRIPQAVQDAGGQWALPFALDTLLFWAWQRWEIEVCHRELKATFGLGHKQCWNPRAAVASVQWSAWVYAVLLAGYRTWDLCRGAHVPTRWWRGSGRWSLNTLWRAYRAALWGAHDFRPLLPLSPDDWAENDRLLLALRHAAFASAPA